MKRLLLLLIPISLFALGGYEFPWGTIWHLQETKFDSLLARKAKFDTTQTTVNIVTSFQFTTPSACGTVQLTNRHMQYMDSIFPCSNTYSTIGIGANHFAFGYIDTLTTINLYSIQDSGRKTISDTSIVKRYFKTVVADVQAGASKQIVIKPESLLLLDNAGALNSSPGIYFGTGTSAYDRWKIYSVADDSLEYLRFGHSDNAPTSPESSYVEFTHNPSTFIMVFRPRGASTAQLGDSSHYWDRGYVKRMIADTIKTPFIRDSIFYSDSGFVNTLRAKSGTWIDFRDNVRMGAGDTFLLRDATGADSNMFHDDGTNFFIKSDNIIRLQKGNNLTWDGQSLYSDDTLRVNGVSSARWKELWALRHMGTDPTKADTFQTYDNGTYTVINSDNTLYFNLGVYGSGNAFLWDGNQMYPLNDTFKLIGHPNYRWKETHSLRYYWSDGTKADTGRIYDDGSGSYIYSDNPLSIGQNGADMTLGNSEIVILRSLRGVDTLYRIGAGTSRMKELWGLRMCWNSPDMNDSGKIYDDGDSTMFYTDNARVNFNGLVTADSFRSNIRQARTGGKITERDTVDNQKGIFVTDADDTTKILPTRIVCGKDSILFGDPIAGVSRAVAYWDSNDRRIEFSRGVWVNGGLYASYSLNAGATEFLASELNIGTANYSIRRTTTGDTNIIFEGDSIVRMVCDGTTRFHFNLETYRESLALGTGSTVIADTVKSKNILPMQMRWDGINKSDGDNAVAAGGTFFFSCPPSFSNDSLYIDSIRMVLYCGTSADSIDSIRIFNGITRLTADITTLVYRDPTNYGAAAAAYYPYTYIPTANSAIISPDWRIGIKLWAKEIGTEALYVSKIYFYGRHK